MPKWAEGGPLGFRACASASYENFVTQEDKANFLRSERPTRRAGGVGKSQAPPRFQMVQRFPRPPSLLRSTQ